MGGNHAVEFAVRFGVKWDGVMWDGPGVFLWQPSNSVAAAREERKTQPTIELAIVKLTTSKLVVTREQDPIETSTLGLRDVRTASSVANQPEKALEF